MNRNSLPEGFQAFWVAYPRKVSKGAAYKAWIKNNCEEISEDIVKAVKRQTFADDQQFIPHAATWLNGWRWMDETSNSNDSALRDALR